MTKRELAALRKMSIPAIRRAQGIVAIQIPLAYEIAVKDNNPRPLVKLQEWERDYIEELCRRMDAA